MHKVIIEPTRKFGVYQVILLERRAFYFLSWWKEISLNKYDEDTAFSKCSDLIEKYDIQSGDVYDWSGDGFNYSI